MDPIYVRLFNFDSMFDRQMHLSIAFGDYLSLVIKSPNFHNELGIALNIDTRK